MTKLGRPRNGPSARRCTEAALTQKPDGGQGRRVPIGCLPPHWRG